VSNDTLQMSQTLSYLRAGKIAVTALNPVTAFDFRWGNAEMSMDKARTEVNLLSAFALTIVGAFAAGLPMALAIIWVCS
jgi:hypothetical protein